LGNAAKQAKRNKVLGKEDDGQGSVEFHQSRFLGGKKKYWAGDGVPRKRGGVGAQQGAGKGEGEVRGVRDGYYRWLGKKDRKLGTIKWKSSI